MPRYNSAVEGARFFCALAVIWIHTAESDLGIHLTGPCRIAVPFFTFCLVVFNQQRLESQEEIDPLHSYIYKKFCRLYIPFLVWSVIYLLLRLIKHSFIADHSPLNLDASVFLNGTTHHLWFLPAALLVSAGIYPFAYVSRQLSPFAKKILAWVCLALSILAVLNEFPVPLDVEKNPTSYFLNLVWAIVPTAFAAVAYSLVPVGKHLSALGRLIALAALTGCLVFLLNPPFPVLIPTSGAILLWLLLQFRITGNLSLIMERLGGLSFGIYLVHVAVVEFLQAAFKMGGLPISFNQDLLVASMALVVSIVAVCLGRRSAMLRMIFP
jgi:peptidoglycan/LPS O-acetylase OafA/YrhL